MLLQVYCFFDRKAAMFSQPYYFPSKAHAIRGAMELAQDTSTTIGRYPSDFDLFSVGEFDDASGTFSGRPDFVANCQSLLVQSISKGETEQ